MSVALIGSLALFLSLLCFLKYQQNKQQTLSRLVLIGLGLGSGFGLLMQMSFGSNDPTMVNALQWINIVGGGYIALLKMIIMPLVLISMIAAVVKLDQGEALGRMSALTISVLLITTAISALVGIFITHWLGVSADGLTEGTRETARLLALEDRADIVSDLSIPTMLVSFMPTNPFLDLTGARSTSIIAIVIFGILREA